MLSFEASYFYLLAVGITLVNFFKKIYFTTSYYNQSLRTKLPEQNVEIKFSVVNGSDRLLNVIRLIRTSSNEKLSIKTETNLVNNNDLLKKKINLQIEKDKIFSEIVIKNEEYESEVNEKNGKK